MAFKDWGFFPRLGAGLAEAGYDSFAFNFSHNGVKGTAGRITDFRIFERNTFSKELEDLDAVVAAATEGILCRESERKSGRSFGGRKIVLAGHSRGGGIAVIHAARDGRIDGLVTLSSISTFDRWTGHQKKVWREVGHYPPSHESTGSPLRVGIGLLNDLEANCSALDIRQAARQIAIPWLILHGEADVVVKPNEAEDLFGESDRSKTTKLILRGVGHTYEADDPTRSVEMVLIEMIRWLNAHMKESR